jgi:hypothetical protein
MDGSVAQGAGGLTVNGNYYVDFTDTGTLGSELDYENGSFAGQQQ